MGVVYMELGMDEKSVKYLEKSCRDPPYDYQSGIISALSTEDWKSLKALGN
jgi:hypothetical protein